MTYNFDKVIDRKNTNSWKYDFYDEYNKTDDTYSMWIADMDFETFPEMREKLKEIADFGIFGYGRPRECYYKALNNWYKTHFDFDIKSEDVVFTPGIVFAINQVVKAFTNEGDGVLVQRPVYYPFLNAIKNNNRKLINNPLINKDGDYFMDFADLEDKIVKNNVKLMILCSPHNPVGRVWTYDELAKVNEITAKHNVLVVADEIHCDFVYNDIKHTCFMNIKGAESHSIVCTAPSKTFNLAGLQTSNIIVKDKKIREIFKRQVLSTGYEYPNIFGITACEIAYTYGEEWFNQLKQYLYKNYEYMVDFCKDNLPKVKISPLQGTYLPWFDMNWTGLSHEEIMRRVNDVAKLWLDEGTIFGDEGKGFIRFNIACPRSVIADAMQRLKSAFEDL